MSSYASIIGPDYTLIGDGHFIVPNPPGQGNIYIDQFAAGAGWVFSHFEYDYVKPSGSSEHDWMGDIEPYLVLDEVNARVELTWPPTEHGMTGGRLYIRVYFQYVGGGTTPTDIITVTTSTTGAGSGYTYGGGRYTRYTSYTVTAEAAPGSKFIKWTSSTGETSTSRSVTRNATVDVTWTAEFQPVKTVKLYKMPVAGGTSTEDAIWNATATGFGEYAVGETCTISITPSSGAQIVQVRDRAGTVYTVSGNSLSFTVTTDVELLILCAWATMTLSLAIGTDGNISDSSGGSVSPDPSGSRAAGYTVELTASPKCGFLAGYSDSNAAIFYPVLFFADNNANPATLTLTGNLGSYVDYYFPGVSKRSWFSYGQETIEAYFHSESDGKIIYSPGANGAILYGANGMPMAQFKETP